MVANDAEMNTEEMYDIGQIQKVLAGVYDPEIPVITIAELGILRDVYREAGQWVIVITPTYSGCPAMDMISMNIRLALHGAGISDFRIESQLSPAWTTDWMTASGKQKLREFGIAPPIGMAGEEDLTQKHPPCPVCHSGNTSLVSEFGSTACKALFRCLSCREPFDYFKCH